MCSFICSTIAQERYIKWLRLLSCINVIGDFTNKNGCGSRRPLTGWRKIPREMILDQKHLEGKPSAHLNAMNNNNGANAASTSANNGNTPGLTSTPMGPSAGVPSLGGMGGVPDHQDLARK
ncbi:hypothetical protein Ddc_04581 [Ditylenchus destructor]|nr:hypothetical protein Ddc_04581 [Ditylenchus destructor]